MGWPEADLDNMRAALTQAERGAQAGEVPVGAVVTQGPDIVAGGHNRTIIDRDPTGHAEIVALRIAAGRLDNHRLEGTTVYVTLEPCVMCMAALAQARISRLVFGAYDPKAGAAGSVMDLSSSAALNHRFEVNGGVLEHDCGKLLAEFFAGKRVGS